MKYSFRETSPEDSPAVAEFLQGIFSSPPGAPLTEPGHLYWKSWADAPGWQGSRGYIFENAGRIVAHGTVMPLPCADSTERLLRIVHVIDWAGEPKAVGSGVNLMKRIFQMCDGILAVGGSQMTQKILPMVGFRTCAQMTRFALPLRPLQRIAGQKMSARTIAQFGRSVLWSMQAPSMRVPGWSAERISPAGLAAFPSAWPRPTAGVTQFERSQASFEYLLGCPITPFELFAVSNSSGVCGYFLLAYTPGQVRIADLHIDSMQPDDWTSLVKLAVTQARRRQDAAEVMSIASDDLTRQALERCGFHSREDVTVRILCRHTDFPLGAMRLRMIDNDAAYLHRGLREFIA